MPEAQKLITEANVEEIELDDGQDFDLVDENEEASISEEKKPFDSTKINIEPKQDTLRNLIERLRHEEIDMNTDFQRRGNLWSDKNMSRLIESILIRFPLPAFYFDASNDSRWLVIDGLQRLSSIKKFVLASGENRLRLSGLEYLKDLTGKTYDDLSREQKRRIDECPIILFRVLPSTPADVKIGIFRRINTGGTVLNNQEIRNALANTREREFLTGLSENALLIKTMGDQSKRMLDQELVLRFIAFSSKDYLTNHKDMAKFIDEALESLQKDSDEKHQRLAARFHRSLSLCYELFGERAFEKPIPEGSAKRRRKNTALFEVWMVTLEKTTDGDVEKLIQHKEQVNEKLKQLIEQDEVFFRSISFSTQKKEHVQVRYARIQTLIEEIKNQTS